MSNLQGKTFHFNLIILTSHHIASHCSKPNLHEKSLDDMSWMHDDWKVKWVNFLHKTYFYTSYNWTTNLNAYNTHHLSHYFVFHKAISNRNKRFNKLPQHTSNILNFDCVSARYKTLWNKSALHMKVFTLVKFSTPSTARKHIWVVLLTWVIVHQDQMNTQCGIRIVCGPLNYPRN